MCNLNYRGLYEITNKQKSDYKKLPQDYFFPACQPLRTSLAPDLRIKKTIRTIKSARVKKPNIIDNNPKRFKRTGVEEKRYNKKDTINKTKKIRKFLHET